MSSHAIRKLPAGICCYAIWLRTSRKADKSSITLHLLALAALKRFPSHAAAQSIPARPISLALLVSQLRVCSFCAGTLLPYSLFLCNRYSSVFDRPCFAEWLLESASIAAMNGLSLATSNSSKSSSAASSASSSSSASSASSAPSLALHLCLVCGEDSVATVPYKNRIVRIGEVECDDDQSDQMQLPYSLFNLNGNLLKNFILMSKPSKVSSGKKGSRREARSGVNICALLPSCSHISCSLCVCVPCI